MKRLLLCLLVSCAAHPAIAQEHPLSRCLSETSNDPAYSPLASRFPLGTEVNPTFSMLTDETTPTPAEAKLIKDWAGRRDRCIQDYARPEVDLTPELRAAWPQYRTRGVIAVARLAAGQMTFGEYARYRAEAQAAWLALVERSEQDERLRAHQEQQQRAAVQALNDAAAERQRNAIMSNSLQNFGNRLQYQLSR